MFKFLRRPIAIFLIIFIAAGIYGYFYFFKKSEPLPETFIAKRGTIIQEVSVTGKTKPAEDIDLAFEQAGKAMKIKVAVGDKVMAGQSLVELDSSELYVQLLEAEANTETQKAELEELKKGAKPEEIAVYETKVLNAEISLEDAKRKLIDKIQDGYTKAEDAVRGKIDQFFNNPRGQNPSLVFSSSFKLTLEGERPLIEFILNSWKASLEKLIVSGDLNSYLDSAKQNLNQIKLFLEKVALAVNGLTASADLSQTTIDTYKSTASTARTNVNTAITNLQSAEETWRAAESDVSLAEKELVLKKSSATTEQISGQEAAVKQAEAKAQLIRVKISKNILRSPIDGVVAKQEAKVGEIVSANAIIVSVISLGGFELETNVPEADIAKLAVGDSAKITLDAFGSEAIFEAKVTAIEPGETIIEGVATYKTTLHFIEEKQGIKPGMTANIDILTAKKENAIIIPQRLVISKNGGKFVKILNSDGTTSEISVQTGLRGSDGNIEIILGINEGEKVVISAK